MSGPLTGIRVIEIAGLGPTSFCGMMLADMGADLIRIERKGVDPLLGAVDKTDVLVRGRRSIALDLKNPSAVTIVLRMLETSQMLTEGFRPGVMERLGLGPDVCHRHNPKLVYGRLSGWGQKGALASAPGHDIDYIAITGALGAIGTADGGPVPPLNLLANFGGGGMLLAFGLVCALFESTSSGRGQVVDAAMVDGAALLMSMIYGLRARGSWHDERGQNWLDGGAHFYGTYRCADGKWIAIGAVEPQFYKALLKKLGSDALDPAAQWNPKAWPEERRKLAEIFASKTRDHWCALLENADVCFAPVLDLAEAPGHPHNVSRGIFIEVDGVIQPAPAPRFSRTAPQVRNAPPSAGADGQAILSDFGFKYDEIESLRNSGAVQ